MKTSSRHGGRSRRSNSGYEPSSVTGSDRHYAGPHAPLDQPAAGGWPPAPHGRQYADAIDRLVTSTATFDSPGAQQSPVRHQPAPGSDAGTDSTADSYVTVRRGPRPSVAPELTLAGPRETPEAPGSTGMDSDDVASTVADTHLAYEPYDPPRHKWVPVRRVFSTPTATDANSDTATLVDTELSFGQVDLEPSRVRRHAAAAGELEATVGPVRSTRAARQEQRETLAEDDDVPPLVAKTAPCRPVWRGAGRRTQPWSPSPPPLRAEPPGPTPADTIVNAAVRYGATRTSVQTTLAAPRVPLEYDDSRWDTCTEFVAARSAADTRVPDVFLPDAAMYECPTTTSLRADVKLLQDSCRAGYVVHIKHPVIEKLRSRRTCSLRVVVPLFRYIRVATASATYTVGES